jgi:Protein of unknown function (DUF4012)
VVVPLVGGLVLVTAWCLVAVDAAGAELNRAKDALVDARSALTRADAETAHEALDRAESHLAAADRSTSRSPFAVLAPVPLLGSPAAAVSSIDDAAASVIEAGRVLADTVDRFPTSGSVGVDGTDLSPFREAALDSTGALDAARARFDEALAALDGPSGAALPMISAPARDLASELTAAADQLDGAERGLTLLADLAAPTTDAKILVLSQDTMELRATGGYIGTYGVVHFDHGTVSLDRFHNIDDLGLPDPPLPPPDVRAGDYLSLANVNWSPDFAVTAARVEELFERSPGGEPIEGVLAITEDVMADLVGALGPIRVPGFEEPVVEEGFAERVLYEVELKRPLDTPRKKFLIELSDIVFDQLFSLEGGQVPGVIDAFALGGSTGGAQAWFSDDRRQQLVDGTTWAGQLPDPSGESDFVMLVDSNLSPGKANADLVRTLHYEVEERDGRLLARMEASYRNDGVETAVNPFYAGYVRLFVPPDAEIVNGGDAYDEGAEDELGFKVLASSVYVEPGGTDDIVFEYWLPERLADDYRLRWVRQAGTTRDRLQATVRGERAELSPDRRELVLGSR